MNRYPTALSIAGSDSSGGAGIQADLKTFSALGVYGMTAITAITAQNTIGVKAVQAVKPEILRDQLDAVFSDIQVDAVKTGMLNDKETVQVVIEAIDRYMPRWVIVDPVMVSTSGSQLLDNDAIELLKAELLPRANLVTPNIPEAECLSGEKIDSSNISNVADELVKECRLKAVLLKGGHLDGNESFDLFLPAGIHKPEIFQKKRIDTVNTHGTGCTLSAAITAYLSLGMDLYQAIDQAERYITKAITFGADVLIGHGYGPVNHLFSPESIRKIPIER